MPFVTHFKSPAGDDLPIAASELAVVEVPAAGSDYLGDWSEVATPGKYTRYLDLAAPADSAILPSDQSLITDHGLTITHDEQGGQWVLQLDSLPAEACTLALLFIHCENGGEPLVLPALGGGGGGLPKVTAEDEGKFVQVVGGAYKLVALTDVSEEGM